MNAPVFQITISACVDANELAGVLACPEFLGAWEEDELVVLYWQENGAEILQRVRSAVSGLGVNLPEGSIHCRPVIAQDWNAKWAASVQPIRIGHRIGIRPSWATMDMPGNGIELIISQAGLWYRSSCHHPINSRMAGGGQVDSRHGSAGRGNGEWHSRDGGVAAGRHSRPGN